MSDDDACPYCGLTYDRMRTGLDFAEVRRMMFSHSPDPADWRYRRRHGVLGYWRQLKKMQWESHLAECAYYFEQYRKEAEGQHEQDNVV